MCEHRAISLLDRLRPQVKVFVLKGRTVKNLPHKKCKCKSTNSSVLSLSAATIRPQQDEC